MNESAAEFETRDRFMQDRVGPRSDWPSRGPPEIALILDALGAAPDGFARVLDLADEMGPGHTPAGLSDVAQGYRIGVTDPASRSSGYPLGIYKGVLIVAWTTAG